jgi:hypothetical protein
MPFHGVVDVEDMKEPGVYFLWVLEAGNDRLPVVV